MSVNIPSLKAKLLNMAKEKNLELQVLLDRFGAEQFLARLSQSPVANQFIFKGGSLLVYLNEPQKCGQPQQPSCDLWRLIPIAIGWR